MSEPVHQTSHPQPMIYQLFVGRWSEASLVTHPFRVFQMLEKQSLKPLQDSGFTHIYLLGVFDNRGPLVVGEENGKDLNSSTNRLPSVFAITDHTQTNPLLGSIDDIKQLIKTLHQQGFHVILDFVPNHTSLAHPWINRNSQYYCYREGQLVKEFSGDVAKLNYENEQLVEEMIQILINIAQWGADGVRCDMAHLVPMNFWKKASSYVKSKYPDFLFIAEAYGESVFNLDYIGQLLSHGFNFVYHEPLYKNIKAVFNSQHPLSDLIGHVQYILTQPYSSNLVNYLSNHDDAIPEGAFDYFEALIWLLMCLPGAKLIYNGSLNGLTSRLPHHTFEPLPMAWQEHLNLPNNVKDILEFKQKNQVTVETCEVTADNLVVCTLVGKGKFKLLLNLSNSGQKIGPNFSQPIIDSYKSGDVLPVGKGVVFAYD